MSEDTRGIGARLDSWKAIASYLKRDVATVRRWEKDLGLPVHRVAGGGRSVFAHTAEIDAWLHTELRTSPAATAPPVPRKARPSMAIVAAAVLVVALGTFVAFRGGWSSDTHIVRLDVHDAIVAVCVRRYGLQQLVIAVQLYRPTRQRPLAGIAKIVEVGVMPG